MLVNVILFILDSSEPDRMAEQACSACLLWEGHELDV